MRKKKNIPIIVSIILIMFITVGYSAFNTNISLKVKGNIKEDYFTFNGVTVKLEESGLYKENSTYIYKGSNPNNYIIFNNENYRILSINEDKTIKIIRETPITDKINYDQCHEGYNVTILTNRYNADGYCQDSNGCNWYGSSSSTYDNLGNTVSEITIDGKIYKLPEEDALVNQYLNSTNRYKESGYYSTLSETAKNQIISHVFNIGPVTDSSTALAEEEAYKWKGNIGLASVSDYLNSKLDNSSYMHNIYSWYWLINPVKGTNAQQTGVSIYQYNLNTTGYVYWGIGTSVGIVPVVYLKSDIKLSGDGSENNKFKLKY